VLARSCRQGSSLPAVGTGHGQSPDFGSLGFSDCIALVARPQPLSGLKPPDSVAPAGGTDCHCGAHPLVLAQQAGVAFLLGLGGSDWS